MSTAHGEHDPVRIGSKVPTAHGKGSLIESENLGVSLDVNSAREVGNKFAMDLKADMSAAGFVPGANDLNDDNMVSRQNSWHAPVLIPIRKPTVVFTSENTGNKGGMQVVITATLLQ